MCGRLRKFFKFCFDSESKLNTLVQKLHDFLAHSSEESEETSSPPRLMMNQSTGKLKKNVWYLLAYIPFIFYFFKNFFFIFYLLILERERGMERKTERQTSICFFTYLCIHWYFLSTLPPFLKLMNKNTK